MNSARNPISRAALVVALFTAVPALAFAQSGIISTVAGNTTRSFSGDGGPATSASMNEPYGVVLDSAGNLYIADTRNQRIRKVTRSTGIITTIAGNGTKGYNGDNIQATAAALNDPTTVALDAAGNIYISDQLNDRIRKITVGTGIITTVAGSGNVGFNGDGQIATLATGGSQVQLCHPYGVTLNAAGDIFISDTGNFRIRKVTKSTGIISTIAGNGAAVNGTQCNGQNGTFAGDGGPATAAKLNYPAGVTVDGAGNVYIGDRLNHRIRKVNTAGTISTVAGIGPSSGATVSDGGGYNGDNIQATAAQLNEPYMAALDSAGNLYIPDYFNYRIRKVTVATGVITTVAGIGLSGFDGDGGPATSSFISDPTGTATDAAGNFYIVDQFSARIRIVTAPAPASRPSVTSNPSNQRVVAGATASFSASASGSPAPSVQWQVSTNNGSSFSNISGATSATLSFTTSVADNGKQYRAVFTNSGGSAATAAATLVVFLAGSGTAPRNDIDGDHLADLVVWRPSNGTWFWLTSSSGYNYAAAGSKQWGSQANGDKPFIGDIDGDTKADLIVWRPGSGTWFWLTSSSRYNYASAGSVQWGNQSQGDIPMIGDIDGDGRVDLIVWRPGSGTWFWLTSSSGYAVAASKQWGNQANGDKPLIGDIDGDGRADLTVWRASSGTWFWLTSSSGYNTAVAGAKQWGNQSLRDVPMLGDLDGDARADLVVWRASSGTWFWLTSSTNYNTNLPGAKQWGNQNLGDIPLLADLDGDRRADLTVWRASNGTWFWLTSSSNYNTNVPGAKQWGAQGDLPIVK